MKGWLVKLAGLLLVFLLISCTLKGVPQEGLPPGKVKAEPVLQPPTGVLQQSWEKEWGNTLTLAKKEGRVIVNQTAGAELRQALASAFYSKFGISVESLGGTGGLLSERIIRERGAGLYFSDLWQGGASTPTILLKPAGALDPLEPTFIIPELRDPELIRKVWWEGKLRWVDQEHKILTFMAYPQTWVVVNTELVKSEEVKSWRDLLNPKWKGKMAMMDPSITGQGGKLFSTSVQTLGIGFWREFALQKPVILRDLRMLNEGVANGKYPIALGASSGIVQEFIRAGAPVALRFPSEEGALITGHGSIALVNNAPHPNAAKIFVNWLLSKEGVTLYSKVENSQSVRLDVPVDFLTPDRMRQPGVKYLWPEVEDFLLHESKLYAEAREIFGIGR